MYLLKRNERCLRKCKPSQSRLEFLKQSLTATKTPRSVPATETSFLETFYFNKEVECKKKPSLKNYEPCES